MFFTSLQEKKRLSLGDRLCSRQRAQRSLLAIKAKPRATPTEQQCTVSHLCIPVSVCWGQRRPGLASFTFSSPPLNPWAGFLNHSCFLGASASVRATLETHQCHFSITHQGLFQRGRQSQTPAKIRVLPLSHALCPAQGRINQGSGNWVLPHTSVVMSPLDGGGGGCGLRCIPKDSYYRWMVLL